MKSLFFGASGYIGRHLVQALRANGDEVIVPVASDGTRLDLTQRESLDGIDWNVDQVWVFAGVTGTTVAFDQYERFVRGNELVLLNVLDALRGSGHRPRVIFPSSRLVYRGADAPLPESAPLEARTPYAANKIACEHILQAWGNAWSIPYTVLRICVPYANLIGDQYSFGTVGNFINQAKSNGRIRLYGGGTLRRTFTHIDDLCRLANLAAAHPGAARQTFNIPGEDLSLREAAALIAERFGAVVEAADWPPMDAAIESGSTVFDGALLTGLLETDCSHRLAPWAAQIRTDGS